MMPQSELEAATVQTLAPGAYTASVHDADGGTGIGLLEIYDLDRERISQLGNISARGYVGADETVLISGFVVNGSGTTARLVVRGIGPSLAMADVAEPLGDPVLEIRDAVACSSRRTTTGLTHSRAKSKRLRWRLPMRSIPLH